MTLSHRIAAAAVGLACLASSSWASIDFTLDNSKTYQVEYVEGSGANKAIVSVTLPTAGQVTFGYQWDNTISAYDLLTGLGAAAVPNGLGVYISDTPYGHWLDGFAYNGDIKIQPTGDFTWTWSAFNSFNGTDWTYATAGLDDTLVQNGLFLGFTTEVDPTKLHDWGGGFFSPEPVAPASILPVPEPSSLGILIIALLMKHRRR